MRLKLLWAIVLLAAAPSAAMTVAINTVKLTRQDIREMKARESAQIDFCKSARRHGAKAIETLEKWRNDRDTIFEYAHLLSTGSKGCPRNIDFAIALMDRAIGQQSMLEADPEWLAQQFRYLGRRGDAADLVRANEIARYLTIRGEAYRLGEYQPVWTEAERLQFISRDDVWAYVNQRNGWVNGRDARIDVWLSPSAGRFDPERALATLEDSTSATAWIRAAKILSDGTAVPRDSRRAEELLWKAAALDETAWPPLLDLLERRLAAASPFERRAILDRMFKLAGSRPPRAELVRIRIVPFAVADLKAPDPGTQSVAANLLASYAGNSMPQAAPPVLAWIDGVLATKGEPRRSQAVGLLSRMVSVNVPGARETMERDLARSGGIVEAGEWTPDPTRPVPFQNLFTPNDYPTRALRQELEGWVEVDVVIGPDGKVAYAEVVRGDDPILTEAAVSILRRRLRRVYSEHPGRYVRVRLPKVQFRIAQCGETEPVTPAIPGAALLDGKAMCREIMI